MYSTKFDALYKLEEWIALSHFLKRNTKKAKKSFNFSNDKAVVPLKYQQLKLIEFQ